MRSVGAVRNGMASQAALTIPADRLQLSCHILMLLNQQQIMKPDRKTNFSL